MIKHFGKEVPKQTNIRLQITIEEAENVKKSIILKIINKNKNKLLVNMLQLVGKWKIE